MASLLTIKFICGICTYRGTPMPDLAAKKALVENWKWGFAAHIAPGIGYSVANFIGYSIG
tara:strand:+ start:474 stop:653 length:180 start_codon:yes stop_codon:yes gene_type:complete